MIETCTISEVAGAGDLRTDFPAKGSSAEAAYAKDTNSQTSTVSSTTTTAKRRRVSSDAIELVSNTNALRSSARLRNAFLSSSLSINSHNGGFLDNCRICGVQILRKGQSRPRICLTCEKKKAIPIKDICKDCHDPIIRSNVRKARICHKCKKTRERAKAEGILGNPGSMAAAAAAAAFNNPYFLGGGGGALPPGFAAFRRLYSAKSRLQFLSQYQMLEVAASNESAYVFSSDEDDVSEVIKQTRRKAVTSDTSERLLQGDYEVLMPPLSDFPKIDTDSFQSPESVVDFLLRRLNLDPDHEDANLKYEDWGTGDEQDSESEDPSSDEEESSILVPLVNPYEVVTALAAIERNEKLREEAQQSAGLVLKTIKEEPQEADAGCS